MERTITGLHQDDDGAWVVELDCGHDQHVRHRPPFEQRPWVLSAERRAERIGMPRGCPLCDRWSLPRRTELVRRGPVWDGATMPPGLRRAHRLRPARWAVLDVERGAVRFSAGGGERLVEAGATQAIPPGIEHDVEPLGAARFRVDFFQVIAYRSPPADRDS